MPGTDPASVAAEYLISWTRGELARTRAVVDHAMTFVGPLGTANGAEECLAGLERMSGMVKGAHLHQTFVDGENVCIIYDLLTDNTPAIPTAGWYRVQDGKVVSARVYFDPRPFLGG
jgi:limonene-1,2-epoxide hydrolase